MTDPFKVRAAREHQATREAEGVVADSMDVRRALMIRVHAGEITLEEAQAQLKKIKNGAKRNGQITRNQAYLGR